MPTPRKVRSVYPRHADADDTAPTGESPNRREGIRRTMRPAEKEYSGSRRMAGRGPRPDGRCPSRGPAVYDATEEGGSVRKVKASRGDSCRRPDGSVRPSAISSRPGMPKIPAEARAPFQGTPRSPEYDAGFEVE